eukprot:763020-Hanusia_phi.AAC.13
MLSGASTRRCSEIVEVVVLRFASKASNDKMKESLLAKLASAVANLYASVQTALTGESGGPGELAKHFKGSSWPGEAAQEVFNFRSIAHVHAANGLEEVKSGREEAKGMKKGQELGHLYSASSMLEQACKLKLNNTKEKELKAKITSMQALIAKAKKENDVSDAEAEKVVAM